jgi:hypothetical protein
MATAYQPVNPSTASDASMPNSTNEFEPDDEWKERLQGKISQELDFMVSDATEKLERDIQNMPSEREKLLEEYHSNFKLIEALAHGEYEKELGVERARRHWASAGAFPSALEETMASSQRRILAELNSGRRTASFGSNSSPPHLSSSSTSSSASSVVDDTSDSDREDSEFEPDDDWKTELGDRIRLELDSRIKNAWATYESQCLLAHPSVHRILLEDYNKEVADITGEFCGEFTQALAKERANRRLGSGVALPSSWEDALLNEQTRFEMGAPSRSHRPSSQPVAMSRASRSSASSTLVFEEDESDSDHEQQPSPPFARPIPLRQATPSRPHDRWVPPGIVRPHTSLASTSPPTNHPSRIHARTPSLPKTTPNRMPVVPEASPTRGLPTMREDPDALEREILNARLAQRQLKGNERSEQSRSDGVNIRQGGPWLSSASRQAHQRSYSVPPQEDAFPRSASQ